MTDFSPPVSPIPPDAQRPLDIPSARQLLNLSISQEISSEGMGNWGELDVFNPMAMARRFESLESKLRRKEKKDESEKAQGEEKKVAEVKRLSAISERFQRNNYELISRMLLMLRSRISNADTMEDILRKVLEMYPDFSLADEALDFLLETTDGELHEKVLQAKEDLNSRFSREIRAGRNMGALAREFSTQGLGSPSALRDLYRELTGNPREPAILFEELANQFSYAKMKAVIEFILHSLGGDLKSKGPSISRGELHRLMSETRSLQAILGVYKFFRSRMKLISSSFTRNDLSLPGRVTFELLARLFVKFLQERYPSLDKVLMLAGQLGLSEEIVAQIIVYTQMRDAVRQVAPRLFKSDLHRQDVLLAFMEALEELEDQMEGKEEEQEEEEEKEKDD